MPTPRQPRATDIDRHVGARMRERRTLLGLTQTELAELIGITHQQVHKHETGQDRVSVGRLYRIAGALGVEVAHLFPGQDQTPPFVPPPYQSMALGLARNFMAIADSQHRQLVCNLARALAEGAPTEKSQRLDMGRSTTA